MFEPPRVYGSLAGPVLAEPPAARVLDVRAMQTFLEGHIREGVEQFAVRGRVCFAEIVLGFDQPAAHVVFPDAVDDRLREKWIARLGEPIGEELAAVLGTLR